AERRAVFVRQAAVGDRARVNVDFTSRPARGRIVELLFPGPARIEPACLHAARCGGCDWMHLTAEEQRRGHLEHVRASLPEPWRDHPIQYHPAPETFAYRSRVRLHARGSGGHIVCGINEAESHDPVAVDRCIIVHPAIERARTRTPALL